MFNVERSMFDVHSKFHLRLIGSEEAEAMGLVN